ncbi:MAG: c-type cytochrome [Verrucomicrobiota bacterium]|nr:c-type cytochrome [Verrucomicrobiota bacterium]
MVLLLSALTPAEAAGRRGLILRLDSSTGRSDARAVRLVALHVPVGQSVSPFLQAGAFIARWEGKLVLEKRSRLIFHLEGTGQARALIDGEVMVAAIGTPSESERLRSGEHEFVVEYTPPPEGVAALRLFWEGRDFAREPVPATIFTHDPEDAALEKKWSFRRGRSLVAEKRCASCHDSGAKAVMPELLLKAPSLDGIGNRLRQDWLTRWISNPKASRSSAHMPAVFRREGAEEKAAHIAAYLVADSSGLHAGVAATPAQVREGGHIFYQQGCIACHTLDQKGDGERIGLGGVGTKFREGALGEFLRTPSRFHEGTRMPTFQFSGEEASAVAGFLRSLGEDSGAASLDGDAVKGQVLARSAGCFNCHRRKGETRGEGSRIGLFALKSAECSGVHYDLAGGEKAALSGFLSQESNNESLARWVPAEFAERQYHGLRCNACHARDGEETLWDKFAEEVSHLKPSERAVDEEKPAILTGPPPLNHLGVKLRPGWRTKLFAGEIQPKVRKWLPARMPAFPARARHVSTGFSHAAGFSAEENKQGTLDPAKVRVGEVMTGVEGGLSCGTCHGIADKPAIAVFEGEGPNLRDTGARLARDYFRLWMNDPPRAWPGTIMPKYALDGKTPLTQFYDGDSHKQFEAIYEYLRSLSQK